MVGTIINDIKHYYKISGTSFLIDPGFHCILIYRFGHVLSKSKYRKINPFWYIYRLIYILQLLLLKLELPPSIRIGQNFFLAHPYGLVIGGKTIIGDNVKIGPWVVIGHNFNSENPIIGNNCYIGPHAILLGKITIGNNSIIGAGSVVTKDVPDNHVVYIESIKLKKNDKLSQ